MYLLLFGFLWGLAWGSIVLRVTDRRFTRRDADEQMSPGDRLIAAFMMCAAAFSFLFLSGLALDIVAETTGFLANWGAFGVTAAVLAILSAPHGAVTFVACAALEQGTERPRIWYVAAGAAAVWLAGLLLPLAAWVWIAKNYF